MPPSDVSGQVASPLLSDVQSAIDAFEAASRAIRSFDLDVTVDTIAFVGIDGDAANGAPLVIKKVPPEKQFKTLLGSRQVLSNGRFRIETTSVSKEAIQGGIITVWDGQESLAYDPAQQGAMIEGQSKTLPSSQGFVYQNLFRTLDGEYTYAELLRSRLGVTFTPTDQQTAVLFAPPQPGIRFGTFGIRFVLAVDKGLMPVEISLFPDGSPKPRSTYFIDLEKFASDDGSEVWAPVKANLVTYELDETQEFFGEPLGETHIVIDRSTAKFNTEVDPALFRVDLPVGTKVSDRIRDMSYVVGAESREKYLAELAYKGRLGIQRLADQNPAAKTVHDIRDSSVTGWRRFLLIGNITILIVAAIAIFFRRRRKSSSSVS